MEDNSQNRRGGARKQSLQYLKVCDQHLKEIGRIINLSATGLLMVHDTPIAKGKNLVVAMQLPPSLKYKGTLTFDATCRWTGDDVALGYFRSGLEFSKVSDEQLTLLNELVATYSFEGGSIFDI